MDNKERENFNRNSTLIVEHMKNGLINLIDLHETQVGYGSFENFINARQHEIYHLCYNRYKCCQCPKGCTLPSARVLHPSQLKLLLSKNGPKKTCHNPGQTRDFCCCFAHQGLTTNVLDVTLARCLLVNFCQDVFWYSCLTAQKQTLKDFLTHNKHHIYHLYDTNSRCCRCPSSYVFPTKRQIITKAQWDQLFNTPCLPCQQDRKRPAGGPQTICSASVTPGITVGRLGADMSQLLIDHCCTLKKSIEELVQLRNNVFGHIKEAKISDNNYTKYRYLIESNLLLIARICNKESEVQQNVRNLDLRILDGTLLMQTIKDQLYLKEVMAEEMAQVELGIKEHIDKRMTDMFTTLVSQIEDVLIRNLSFKVAPQGPPQPQIQNSNSADSCVHVKEAPLVPPQLQIQNLNAAESCDIQDSNICCVKWELDTPNSWQVEQIKDTLENVSSMSSLLFKVKFVHTGSLIIVTTVPKHVIMNRQSFEEAVRAFLEKFVEVCGIDTNSPATVHVELTILQDFNDLSTGDKDKDTFHCNVPLEDPEDNIVTEVGLPITSETKESQGENKQKDESGQSSHDRPYKIGQSIFYLHQQTKLSTVFSDVCRGNISDGVMMDDGRLVLCLCAMRRLLICNTDVSEVDSIQLQYQPWYVTSVNNSTVAVTLLGSKCIEMYDINNKYKLRSIQVPGMWCWSGITTINNKLVVCGKNCLYIIDHQTGEKIQTKDIGGCCLHTSGDRIFYCGGYPDDNNLYCYNYTKNKVTKKSLPSPPCRITSLQDGSLYVICWDGSVQHVSSDGQHYKPVTTEGLKSLKDCYVISYNTKQRKLFTCTKTGTVNIYREK